MALSDKEISALYFEALGSQHLREQDRKMVTRFAHAVESEVRKDDEPLIRQMRNALALPCDRWNATQSRIVREAVDAADAWLESKSGVVVQTGIGR